MTSLLFRQEAFLFYEEVLNTDYQLFRAEFIIKNMKVRTLRFENFPNHKELTKKAITVLTPGT